MSVITGDAVTAVRDMEDKEVVDECMKVLRELFKEQVTLCHQKQSVYFAFILFMGHDLKVEPDSFSQIKKSVATNTYNLLCVSHYRCHP